MADLTLVQGVADLRLSEATLRSDLRQARQLILNTARQIERDLTFIATIQLDTRSLKAEAKRIVDQLTQVGGLTIPVNLGELGNLAALVGGTDDAVDVVREAASNLGAAFERLLSDLQTDLAVTVDVEADTTEARADVIRLSRDAQSEAVTVPIRADVDDSELLQLADQLDAAARTFGRRRVAEIVAEPDLSAVTAGLDKAVDEFARFRPPITFDVDRTPIDTFLDRARDESVTLPVTGDTTPLATEVDVVTNRIESDPVTVTARVDLDDSSLTRVDERAPVVVTQDDRRVRRTPITQTATVKVVAAVDQLLADVRAVRDRIESEPITLTTRTDLAPTPTPTPTPVTVTTVDDRQVRRPAAEIATVTVVPDTEPLVTGVRSSVDRIESEPVTVTANVDFNTNLSAKADEIDASVRSRTFGVRGSIRSFADEAVTVPIVPDTEPLVAGVSAATDRIESDPVTVTANVDFNTNLSAFADATDARFSAEAVRRRLSDQVATISVTGDTDPLLADARAAENRIESEPATVTLTADTDPLFAAARSELDSLQSRVAALRVDGGVGPSIRPDELFPPGAFGLAGADAGRSFGQSLMSSLQGVLTTGAAVAGGFLGLTLVRGFQRFTTIRDSVASLTVQLGNAEKAATLLDEVLRVVTGTPFNLDQFAEAASNMVAFGIEAEKIPGYLTAISEVAATRGGRANEYAQRLAISFGQIAVQGRITNDEINQLALTGVPALQILGNAFGETTFDMREMVSKGLVPADQALDALTKGILEGSDGINGATVSFEGTAEALRETLTGSIGGFKAATARFGVSIIEPIEGILVDGFTGASAALDGFGRTVKETLADFKLSGEADAIRGFLQDLPGFADRAVDAFKELGPALAPLAVVLGGAGLGQIATLLGPLGSFLPQITTPLGALTAAVTTLIATSPELREQFVPIFGQLITVVGEAGAVLGPALADAARESVPILLKLGEVAEDLIPVVGDFAVGGAAVIGGFADVLGLLGDVLGAFPTPVLTAIIAGLGTLYAIRAVQSPFTGLINDLARLQTVGLTEGATIGRTTATLDRLGITAQQTARAVGTGAAAIGSGLSGLALASDDATTQIGGAVGALSSIGLAAAAGGPIGAGLAAITLGVGYVAGKFIDAKREAEAFKRAVTESADQIVDDLSRVELAAGEITFEGFEIGQDDRSVQDFVDGLGEGFVASLREMRIGVDDIVAMDVEDVDEAVAALERLRGTYEDIARVDFDEPLGFAEAAGQSLRDLFDISPQGRLVGDIFSVAEALGVVRQEGQTTAEYLAAIESTSAGVWASELLAQAEAYNDLLDQRRDIQDQLADFGLDPAVNPDDIATTITLLEKYGTATAALRGELEDLRLAELAAQEARERWQRELLTGLPTDGGFGLSESAADVLIEKARELSDELGKTVDPIDLFNTGMLDGVGVLTDAVDLGEQLPRGILDAEEASKAWAAAMEGVNSALDRVDSNLGLISSRGDLAAALRGIGESMSDIVNEDELRKAEQIGDQVDRQLDRVRDAADRLAKESLEFSYNEQIALANIAEAEAAGAFKGAIAARRDLEVDRLGVQQLADDLAEEEAKLAELQAQAIEFGNVAAVTFGDVLRQQAANLGLSFADLLILQPTDESQAAFAAAVERPVNAALAIIRQQLKDGDINGALESARTFRAQFVDQWTREFGSKTASELAAKAFDLSDTIIELQAYESVRTFVDAVNDGLSVEQAFLATNLSDEEFALGEGREFRDIVQGLLSEEEFLTAVGLDQESADAMLAQIDAKLKATIFTIGGLKVNAFDTKNPIWQLTPGTYMAKGGILEGIRSTEVHHAQIAHGFRLWAEPETGGEAYIPLTSLPSQRRRSEKILTDVAERFGMAIGSSSDRDRALSLTTEAGPFPATPNLTPVHVAAPAVFVDARPELDGLADAVAAGVGRAMVRTQKADIAQRYSEAVHIEHLHIGGSGSERRTARRVVAELADLSLRRRR